MSIDLTPAREAVESLLMLDTCTIREDADGNTDDVLDPVTLQLTDAADAAVVYTGICSVRNREGEAGITADELAMGEYVVSIPHNATRVPRESDRVTIDTSRDPSLVGRLLAVRTVVSKTLLVSRKLLCDSVEDASR